jgi:hypothetical protein
MKYTIIFILAILLITSVGCFYTGSGNIVEKKFDINTFDKIEASDGFKINISQGDIFSVVVKIDDNMVDHLVVTRENDTLKLEMNPKGGFRNIFTLKAEVTLPKLTSLVLNNGAHATATGSGEEIYIEINNGCIVDLAAFRVKNAIVNVNNGSQITINVIDSLIAKADNGSKVHYLGNPKDLKKEESNGSEITPVNK